MGELESQKKIKEKSYGRKKISSGQSSVQSLGGFGDVHKQSGWREQCQKLGIVLKSSSSG